jgi:transcriptional regulator with XRE-family HTH domain
MISEISKRIRQARRRQGATQAQLAERLGVTQQLVSSVERGRGGLKQVVHVCRGLGLPLRIQVGDASIVLAHALDPEERKEIEANIDWFSGLPAGKRLRTVRLHVEAAERLRRAVIHEK